MKRNASTLLRNNRCRAYIKPLVMQDLMRHDERAIESVIECRKEDPEIPGPFLIPHQYSHIIYK